MTRFLLIRHAVNEWVNTGKLAGWTPGVHLNDEGLKQAEALGERLAKTRIDAIYSSPLVRTVETAQAIIKYQPHLTLQLEYGIGEVRYGEWEGQEIKKLAEDKAWATVQHYPTRMQFPQGETMREVQARAVNVLEHLQAKHGDKTTIAVVSHSDVIKMVVAHYLGMHLDLFQRIVVSPASLTVLGIDAGGRPVIATMNDVSHIPETKPPNVEEKTNHILKAEDYY